MTNKLNDKDRNLISLLREYQTSIRNDQTQLREIGGVLNYKIALFNKIFKDIKKTCSEKDLGNIYEFTVDEENVLTKLSKLTTLHNGEEIPIFSESFLYDTVGKDDARTILCYLNELCRNDRQPDLF